MARPRLTQNRKRRHPVMTHLTDAEWRAVKRIAGDRSISDYLRDLVRAALNLSEREES